MKSNIIILLLTIFPLISLSKSPNKNIIGKNWYCELDIFKVQIGDTIFLKASDSNFRGRVDITRFIYKNNKKYIRAVMEYKGGLTQPNIFISEKWKLYKYNNKIILKITISKRREHYEVIFYDEYSLTLVKVI